MSEPAYTITQYFRKLRDPRVRGRSRHLLKDIIVIAICATIANCDDWQEIATFARSRHDWFKKFLRLPNGVPSHDTFERVFDRLDPKQFQECFRSWMQALNEDLGLSQIAIDGKTLRGSGVDGCKPLHLVSAWATANAISLGQIAVAEKSNEITAIPKLLELLDVKGALVTIDAMGCQRAIAQKITECEADYILTVKDNQQHLLNDIQKSLIQAYENGYAGLEYDQYETHDKGHGRKEHRSYTVLHDVTGIQNAADWAKLTTIGFCYSERIVNGVISEELRYFIGSRKASAKIYGEALRNHWGIENKLHWQLDVTFNEDKNRVTKKHGAENLALVRRLALTLLKQNLDKGSMRCKRLKAAIEPEFLQEIITGRSEPGKI